MLRMDRHPLRRLQNKLDSQKITLHNQQQLEKVLKLVPPKKKFIIKTYKYSKLQILKHKNHLKYLLLRHIQPCNMCCKYHFGIIDLFSCIYLRSIACSIFGSSWGTSTCFISKSDSLKYWYWNIWKKCVTDCELL